MFEFERSSPFFETMSSEHPTIVQNIEVVHENRIALDATYHRPKHFILSLNNLLRSLIFFVEHSIKNSPEWLKDAVEAYRQTQRDSYQKLRYLRNVSAHQKLVFPEESLVTGLYRIRSPQNYSLKLGFGDFKKPGKYASDFTLRNTADVFHDLLTFSSIMFMDLEHSAVGGCLGVTRRWFLKIKFKTESERVDEVTDVYQLVSTFTAGLLDHVCHAYADRRGIQFGQSFASELGEHNFINTLLEIDLFPTLFSEWWETDAEPMNFGVRAARLEGFESEGLDELYQWVYRNLTRDIPSYRRELERFANLPSERIFEDDHLRDFLSFVLANHWHYKKVFGNALRSKVSAADVLRLQRLGKMFVEEHRKKKACTIESAKRQLDAHIGELIARIDAKENETPNS